MSLPPDPSLLLEHVTDLVVVTAADGTIRWRSPQAQARLGQDHVLDRVHPHQLDEVRAAVEAVKARPVAVARVACRVRLDSDAWLDVELVVANREEQPGIEGLVWTLHTLAVPGAATAELLRRASSDPLTALANRSALLERLDSDGAGELSCAVLYIDLDGLKPLNDRIGHAAGDEFLVKVASRLRASVRPADTVARIGGDEFVIVAEGVHRESDALEIAERIRALLARRFVMAGRAVSVTASIGLALGCHGDAAGLLKQADTALYEAKNRGRNRVVLYRQAMRGWAEARAEHERYVRHALDDGLLLMYQPVVEVATRRRMALEAMLSFDGGTGEPTGGSARFLDAAERSGLIVSVGAGMLDLACRQLAEWSLRYGAGAAPSISLNFSARQLDGPRVAHLVDRIVRRHDVDPSRICLEVPEEALSAAEADRARALSELKAVGVRLALDDFGAGPSSLLQLERYPIDVVKLDPNFVRAMRGGEVLGPIVGLGEALGLTVVAQGVETMAQADLVHAGGCPWGQGAYFGEPVAAAELPLAG